MEANTFAGNVPAMLPRISTLAAGRLKRHWFLQHSPSLTVEKTVTRHQLCDHGNGFLLTGGLIGRVGGGES